MLALCRDGTIVWTGAVMFLGSRLRDEQARDVPLQVHLVLRASIYCILVQRLRVSGILLVVSTISFLTAPVYNSMTAMQI